MPRSALRCALGAGALSLTASTVGPTAVADGASLSVSAKRLNIQAGSRVTVKGRAAGPVRLQIQRHGRWVTIDRDRPNAKGRFTLRKRLRTATSTRARIRGAGTTRRLG